MPTPRKLPDITTLRRLRRKGWRLAEIAEEYGVTHTGVWRALHAAGDIERQANYKDIAPWVVNREHRQALPMRHIQIMVRLENGKPVSEAEDRRYKAWLKGMEDAGVVLAYHPDAPANAASLRGGFYYVPREAGDDSIFRKPAQ